MAVPIRGMQDIRTFSGPSRADYSKIPYKAYMKLCSLETERFRKGKEFESALKRIRSIEARFKEIEREKAEVLKILDHINLNSSNRHVLRKTSTSTRDQKMANRFKIKY